MKKNLRNITFLSLLFFSFTTLAQTPVSGIRGTIKSDDGTILSFATIFVKQTGTGVAANAEGQYEITGTPRQYDLVFQHLGYKTVVRTVMVEAGKFITLDVSLTPQEFMLKEVVVGGDGEDPAYTIMRKAIAKANYHRNQLDNYAARVYMKGAGKLKDYPWLAKRQLQKAGVEKGRVYISESVSEIKFTRPNKFEEKVISIRSDGKDGNTSPNQFINASFYEPVIAEIVSPLSPKAFSYYKFEYIGSYTDRDYTVSKIKIIPRSKGDNVIDGVISIVEDWWSIHSLDIHTQKLGIDVNMKSVYAPIEEKAWLPVSHQFKIDGKVFGFEFEFKYLATISDYKIKLNPALYVEPKKMEVIDEKIEKQVAKTIQQKNASQPKSKTSPDQSKLQERLASGEEITRKELKSLMKEYEKEEQKKQKEPEVMYETTFKIDSGAYKKDSTYWNALRPIPLTQEEVKGYQKSDSMAVIERKKEVGDTVKTSKHKGFQITDLILGDSYKVGKHSNFKIHFPMPGFNTVEGWNFVYKVSFGTIRQDSAKTRITITPAFRYAFAREVGSGYLRINIRNKKHQFVADGGRYIKQYNGDQPILPIVNDFTTLFMEKNLMKIYERRYIDLKYTRRISDYVSVSVDGSWSQRHELQNNTNWKLIDWKNVDGYTQNRPVNEELGNTGFPDHEAFVGHANVTLRPWLKFKKRNDRRQEIENSSPTFMIDYRSGIPALGGDVDFKQVELGIRHQFKVGVRGTFDYLLRAGTFLTREQMYFMDYKHFLGNKTPFSTSDPVGSFRLLDYYQYSTDADGAYFAGSAHYQFRKFLATRFPFIRMMGIRENVFVNYLATPASKNYTELGYSINGILRIFRLEAAASFLDGKFLDYGFRIGIATNIVVNFND
ncbi:DUF5686 and carboxypeptidase regulatory-like domain-containing protein [Pseudochryseolinea flava]|uniref:Carboxypeptidase-like regulatory domain-containing protein n=1 Tax=Pseudochryseolinea flava TaxID=2059302 RepID=A0A364YAW5_9BACT|nr:DUF5686 and carboxypeptidase regulatory-like domain-containing protein [Pseudochryseolinea flava]RAW02978.1 carboxypeptidase-like regulatory domain-containing protein [Pseudochryseolinea flava]